MKNKDNSINKGNYIIENKDKLLNKRKKKKKTRHLMLLVIIMVSTLITLCLKLSYFNITNIDILGNVNSSKAEVNEKTRIHLNNNIFYTSFKESEKQILKNAYISGVKIVKVLPNRIVIEIDERVAVFHGKVKDTYYIIDNKGILLEKRSSVKDMNTVNLVGLNLEKIQVGELVLPDNRKVEIVNHIANIINDYRKTKDNVLITKVDVTNVLDVKVFSGEMCIKFGTTEDLEYKFNKALNIISQPKYKTAIGYVDVSFKGNPVVFIEE